MKILGFEVPKIIQGLCKPAQFYLLLSFFSVILYLVSMIRANDTLVEAEPEGGHIHHYTLMGLIMKLVFIILWTSLLNYICKFKYGKKISWFIVLLPFFFMALAIIGLFLSLSYIAVHSEKNKELSKELTKHKNMLVESEKRNNIQQQVPVKSPEEDIQRPVIEGYSTNSLGVSGY